MTLPATMTAIAIRAPGGPEVLVPEQRPVPQAGAGEILADFTPRRRARPRFWASRSPAPSRPAARA